MIRELEKQNSIFRSTILSGDASNPSVCLRYQNPADLEPYPLLPLIHYAQPQATKPSTRNCQNLDTQLPNPESQPLSKQEQGGLQSHNSSAVVNTEGGEVCKRTSFLHDAIGAARPGGDNFRRVIPQYKSKNFHGVDAGSNATIRLLQAPTAHK